MPRRGRGGGGGGGGGGGRGRGGAGRGRGGGSAGGSSGRVAKPTAPEFPTSLIVIPVKADVPAPLITAFPEFTQAQPFFSALERLNPEYGGSVDAYKACWVGLSGELLESVERENLSSFDANLVMKDGTKQAIFVKRIHLLEPVSAMEGSYVWPSEGALPAASELWKRALAKINDPLNEAYVDALFAAYASKLVESGLSPHWCRSFGTYTARVDKYIYNITDDYASLKQRIWWRRNQRIGLFSLFKDETATANHTAFLTEDLEELDAGDFVSISGPDEIHTKNDAIHVPDESEPMVTADSAGDEPVHLTVPKLRLKRLSTSEDSGESGDSDDSGSDGSGDSEESEIQQFVEFRDFPVQVTLLERAEGTLDELLDNEDDDDAAMVATKDARWAAWLFQICAALTSAQHYFGFVHNDLHTNNVMWCKTDATHMNYRLHKGKESWTVKVPTYGYVIKIIDFGRASFHLPDPAGFFISDAFYPDNDAATQYNCEPFYDSDDGPRVEPNTSFDLCRLAVSLLESLYPDVPAVAKPVKVLSKEGSKIYSETSSSVYNMLWGWLIDDDGKNVLRSPTGSERYPDFDLYRALAADVHRAVPKLQLEKALFAGYKCTVGDIEKDAPVYDLYI
jgi:hypothetical protein